MWLDLMINLNGNVLLFKLNPSHNFFILHREESNGCDTVTVQFICRHMIFTFIYMCVQSKCKMSSGSTSISQKKCFSMTVSILCRLLISIIWEKQDTILNKHPMISRCPLIGLSLEDRLTCNQNVRAFTDDYGDGLSYPTFIMSATAVP